MPTKSVTMKLTYNQTHWMYLIKWIIYGLAAHESGLGGGWFKAFDSSYNP